MPSYPTALIKTGTRVRCRYAVGDRTVTATVKRIPRAWQMDGWVPVLFDDSAPGHRGMMVHRDQVEVIDNRPGYGWRA